MDRSERALESAGTGAVSGGLTALLTGLGTSGNLKKWLLSKGIPLAAVAGGTWGGATQALGDTVTDDPESALGQAGAGAAGGALLGAPLGLLATGKLKGGMSLAKWLAQKRGVGVNRAAAELMGAGAAGGAALGAVDSAYRSGMNQRNRSE
jgi:hypothetical protein